VRIEASEDCHVELAGVFWWPMSELAIGARVLNAAGVGTFQPYEGLDLLVRAMSAILSHAPGGVSSLAHVTFTGRVPHAFVRSAYAIADIVVCLRLLTRITALTTPLKPLEAISMSIGRALISDVRGMHELVRECETGATFPAGDVDGLARVWIRRCEGRLDSTRMNGCWSTASGQSSLPLTTRSTRRLADLALFPKPVTAEQVATIVR
jgi:glycosyltransferase involved in cell wall biosynthesis